MHYNLLLLLIASGFCLSAMENTNLYQHKVEPDSLFNSPNKPFKVTTLADSPQTSPEGTRKIATFVSVEREKLEKQKYIVIYSDFGTMERVDEQENPKTN